MVASCRAPTVAPDALRVDDFGLSIGPVSVGLPRARTADDVYRRYLDLVGIMGRAPGDRIVAPVADLDALAHATGVEPTVVERRLDALQTMPFAPRRRRPPATGRRIGP